MLPEAPGRKRAIINDFCVRNYYAFRNHPKTRFEPPAGPGLDRGVPKAPRQGICQELTL